MLQLTGIMPPLATPFDGAGNLDLASLAKNVSRYNETGLAGYLALGSNGEAVHLSSKERREVIATVKRAATAHHTILAGINEFSTRAALEAIHAAQDAGADAALVVTPYFYKGAMTQPVLANFFTSVADASPLPVLIYNVPQNTGVVIEAKTIASLTAHQNIIGLKDSSGNMMAMIETLRLVPDDFAVFVGNGSILYPALAMGAKGAVLAVANIAPQACVDLFLAVEAGNHERARELQKRLAPVSQIVTAGLGVAGLKTALQILGYHGGLPCAPLLAVSETESHKLKSILRESGLFPGLE
ncbi:MAG: dihydrodipicolinate synthase family protein [Acidobacteriota bacterium]